ncbi:MAG: hypothetical protein A2172_04515 [Candidatus Woykebacteria bacterium RBG_13_40_15]|uniref:PEP-utilising enzyme mobile domain-containing protein n=1 Tax=Candidatus Woykebacteria bacterium RBG_13_40_15 TaxID=1802593 RepID=A0A1G1W7Y1_9BACT|nr:MAG: hypothetical protein A2172_04515 [Candidatus Woykebacteria bacterium RBG_13_40_15]
MGNKVLLKGTGASPGIVRGIVRLVKFQEEVEMLSQGEILVTSFINPDFVSSIKRNPKISGIITDKGGATCHAAIIAREFKISYIAGAAGATKRLKNNLEVIIDGGKGIIYEAPQ